MEFSHSRVQWNGTCLNKSQITDYLLKAYLNIQSHGPVYIYIFHVSSLFLTSHKSEWTILALNRSCQTELKVTVYAAAVWSAARCSLLRINQRFSSVREFRSIASFQQLLLWKQHRRKDLVDRLTAADKIMPEAWNTQSPHSSFYPMQYFTRLIISLDTVVHWIYTLYVIWTHWGIMLGLLL